jgi:hypothetical protein
MKIFKSYTYKWWQLGIFKLALISFGIVIGSYFHAVFNDYLIILTILWVVSAGYILYISLK